MAAGAVLAGGLAYYRANTGTTDTTQPAASVASSAPAPAAAAPAAIAAAPEAADAVEPEITQSLKGRDFTLRVSVNGNDSYRNVDIGMDDGTPIQLLRSLEGQSGPLDNITFAPADKFELINLLAGEPREQIVCQGSQWLTRGEGGLGSYTIYRIEGERLQELVSVITERDREGDDGKPAKKLEAQVEHTTRDGVPALLYRVKKGAEPERTIVFLWNGKRFDDASGAYQKIADEYLP